MPPNNASLELGLEALEAKAELEKSGYRLPGKPLQDMPRLPTDGLSLMTDDQLMDLFLALTRWLDHIAGQLGLTEIDERYADSAYDLAWAEVLVTANVGKAKSESSVTMAKAEAMTNEDVQKVRQRKDQCYARRKVLQLMHSNLERDSALVSRELTRRVGRHDWENRGGKWRP